jgi:segregation and condensation protein B
MACEGTMSRRARAAENFDRELAGLPEEFRWREYMMRIEAVIFAAAKPVSRETLAAVIGADCHLDHLIADISEELRARPYKLVEVAGGFQYRTRRALADVIRAAGVVTTPAIALSPLEQLVLTVVGYFQPVTRQQIADIVCKPVSRDTVAALRSCGLVATGPRAPQPGAPYTYVTTPAFLEFAGLPSLRDLPDLDRLEEAGLLGTAPLPEELRSVFGITDDVETEDAARSEAEEELVHVAEQA